MRRLVATAISLAVLMQVPATAFDGRAALRDEARRVAGLECSSQGRVYPEGTQAEGTSPQNLCLPMGVCATASVVLPVYQCSGGRWHCIRNCR
jgi:hypothetical protein